MSIKILRSTTDAEGCNLLIVLNDMIVDMISNEKHNQIVTELFIITIIMFRSYSLISQYRKMLD